MKRKYISVDEIQKEYLNISKRKIRALVKGHLPMKFIGGRIFTERDAFEQLLSDPERMKLPLD